jgi:hypothetical protein
MKTQLCCFAVCIATALFSDACSATAASIWVHNGSEISLVASGNNRKLYYEKPRPTLAAQGVTRGTLLFDGRRNGNSYAGKAYVFSLGCPAVPYEVSGQVSSDERTINLAGRAPIRNKQCDVEGYRDDVLTFAFVEVQGPGEGLSFCAYRNAIVPCTRLTNPGGQAAALGLDYQFAKAVPLWPNQALFGSAVETTMFKGEDNEYYNRTVTGVSRDSLISKKPLTSEPFDATFVDVGLAESRGRGAVWTKYNSKLVAIEDTFRGAEVFEFWSKATSRGAICGSEIKPTDDDEFPFRACAFARKTSSSNSSLIEYCAFRENTDSQVKDAPLCINVASEKGGKRRVLSTWYSRHDVSGGAGGESEIKCEIPHQKVETVSALLQSFLESYLGQSSRVSKRQNFSRFDASGSRIAEPEEKLFVRTFLRGSVVDEAIFMSTSFTVCAQPSDDITDYREPGEAVGNRIRNRFLSLLVRTARKLEPNAKCEYGTW